VGCGCGFSGLSVSKRESLWKLDRFQSPPVSNDDKSSMMTNDKAPLDTSRLMSSGRETESQSRFDPGHFLR
jgi:hypothetical protein